MKKIIPKILRILPVLLFPFWMSFAHTVSAAEKTKERAVSSAEENRKSGKSSSSAYKISVKTNLVMTDVAVTGKNLPKLQAEDFIIYDNNEAQKTAFFSYDQLPIAVAVLVDRSCSVQRIFPYIQVASLLALKNLKPEDQVALFKIGNVVNRVADLTTDRLSLAGEIGRIKVGRGSNIIKALTVAAKYLQKKAPGRRRAIILVSDNCNVGPDLGVVEETTVKKAMDSVLESSAALYSIRFGGAYEKGSTCDYSDGYVRNIAEKSGGGYFVVERDTSLQAALTELIANLRHRYTLGFYPSDPGESGSYHELDIQLRDRERFPPCRVATRKGYYTGVSFSPPEKPDDPSSVSASAENTDSLLIRQAIETAGSFHVNIPDIGINVTTGETAEPKGRPQLEVRLEIDSEDVGFRNSDGLYTGAQEIAVFYAGDKWKILGSERKRIEYRLDPEQYGRIRKTGIRHRITIPVNAAVRTLTVVVYDEVRNQIGSKIVVLPGAPEIYSGIL